MIKLRTLLDIVKRHTKFPLTRINHEWCEGGDPHEPICYAARLLGSELPKVCPHCKRSSFEPEHEEECDLCRYFGIMDITKDGFYLSVDSRIASLQKPSAWVTIVSNEVCPRRVMASHDTSIAKIIKNYIKLAGISPELNYSVEINDGVLPNDDELSKTVGYYVGDDDKVSIMLTFDEG